ncbi:MAG: DUF2478 domain-containing protein [Actinobacteria bacterium]|nr:DUF2478 domain-containing protein [Actinomycetota bacterium]
MDSRPRQDSSVLAVITGESGAGKTTLCADAADYAKSCGLSVGGLLSLPHDAGDGYEWRRVADIDSGEWRVLGRLRPQPSQQCDHSFSLQSEAGGPSQAAGHTSLAWEFQTEVFPWADACLARCVEQPPDVLIVDEVGRLELTRGGGWRAAVPLLAAGGYRLAIAVVRPQLMTAFGRSMEGEVLLHIVEVTAEAGSRHAARNALRRLIASVAPK